MDNKNVDYTPTFTTSIAKTAAAMPPRMRSAETASKVIFEALFIVGFLSYEEIGGISSFIYITLIIITPIT